MEKHYKAVKDCSFKTGHKSEYVRGTVVDYVTHEIPNGNMVAFSWEMTSLVNAGCLIPCTEDEYNDTHTVEIFDVSIIGINRNGYDETHFRVSDKAFIDLIFPSHKYQAGELCVHLSANPNDKIIKDYIRTNKFFTVRDRDNVIVL